MKWYYENHPRDFGEPMTATAWGGDYSDDDIAQKVLEGGHTGDLLDGWDVPDDVRQKLTDNGGMVEWSGEDDENGDIVAEQVRISIWVGGEEFLREVAFLTKHVDIL